MGIKSRGNWLGACLNGCECRRCRVDRFASAKEAINIERKKLNNKIANKINIQNKIEDEGGVVFRNKRIFLYGQISRNKEDRLNKIRQQLGGN